MSKPQKSEQEKIQGWVKFYNDLYLQEPERDYSLEEWHDWYKENKPEIDGLVAEVDNEAKKPILPELVFVPPAPAAVAPERQKADFTNAVAPERQKTDFANAVEKNNDEVKNLDAQEARLIKKIGNEYNSTKYTPLFDAMQEYELRLQHHTKERAPLISKMSEVFKRAMESTKKVIASNNAIADIESEKRRYTESKNVLTQAADDRKKTMEELKNSLASNKDDAELRSKISKFLESLNNEHKSLSLGLPSNLNVDNLDKMDAAALKKTAEGLVQQFDAPKKQGFLQKVRGAFQPKQSHYEMLENAKKAQTAILDNHVKGFDKKLKTLNAGRLKEVESMKRDMEAVNKAQANYTEVLRAHFNEAQKINIRTGKEFERDKANKGQGAEAELAEFEMLRTANALEGMSIDSREITRAAKNAADFTKAPDIAAALDRTYSHLMTQQTANNRLLTPQTPAAQPPAAVKPVETKRDDVSPLVQEEFLAAPVRMPTFEEIERQSELDSLAASAFSVQPPPAPLPEVSATPLEAGREEQRVGSSVSPRRPSASNALVAPDPDKGEKPLPNKNANLQLVQGLQKQQGKAANSPDASTPVSSATPNFRRQPNLGRS